MCEAPPRSHDTRRALKGVTQPTQPISIYSRTRPLRGLVPAQFDFQFFNPRSRLAANLSPPPADG